jgi:hypothetical protein
MNFIWLITPAHNTISILKLALEHRELAADVEWVDNKVTTRLSETGVLGDRSTGHEAKEIVGLGSDAVGG